MSSFFSMTRFAAPWQALSLELSYKS